MQQLSADLATDWRGWYFWQVTVGGGGYNPLEVATQWPLMLVIDTAVGLCITNILESQ